MIRVDVPEYNTFVEFDDGTDPQTIQGVLEKSFPSKPKPAQTSSYILNALGPTGKLPEEFEYNEMGEAVPKGTILKPGIEEPTKPATGVVDFLTRVVPESAYRTAVGVAKFPYDLAKQVTDPIVHGFQRAISGEQDTPENIGRVGKELAGNAYQTLQGLAEFTGKPLGLYGWDELKKAWLSDPAGSALGVAPLVRGIFARAKARGVPKEKVINELVQEVKDKGLGVLYDIPERDSFVRADVAGKKRTLQTGQQLDDLIKERNDTVIELKKAKKADKQTIAERIKTINSAIDEIEATLNSGVLPDITSGLVQGKPTEPIPLIRRDEGIMRGREVNLETGGLQTIYEKLFGNNKPEKYTQPGTPEFKVDEMYDRTQSAMSKRDRLAWNKIKSGFNKGIIDVSGNVKSALAKIGGPEAQRAIMRKDLIAGADSKANMIFGDAEKQIFSDMSPSDYELFNRYRTSKRMVEIEDYKPGVKGPEGIPPADHAAWLDSIPPEKKAMLDAKQSKLSSVYADQLAQLKNAGLLTQEGFDALSKYADYNPRRFMQYLDPTHVFDFGGKKISVPDSGIKALKEGSEGLLFNDSRTLLAQTVVRTQARIFRNEANKALYDLADVNPDNGIVSKASIVGSHKDGSPIFQKAPSGHEKISVMLDGQKREMIMPREMAEEWVKSDPLINRQAANIVGWMLGTKPLKMAATGWNPAFALTNIPRDLQLIWMSTKEYSPAAPVAMSQMAIDIAKVFPDVIRNKGRVTDYINQGGGLEFLTTQGRIGGPFSKVSDVLGWIGTKSEMLSRIALRERAIKNGATPEQATHIARNYLDFSQGGNLVKMADVAFPYLNAAVQASRSLLRAAKTDPKLFAFKVGQIGVMATSIYNINRIVNRKAWDQVSDRDKEFNWVFTLPEDFAYTDENGEKRYLYIKVAKDQAIRPVATMFEALMEKFHTGRTPTDQVLMAWEDFLNVVPINKLPPVFAASLGYLANKDFWNWQDIWKGPEVSPEEEYTDKTHPAFKTMGEYTGLSPERSRYALQSLVTNGNPFVGLVGGGWRLATGDLPEELREKGAAELLSSNKTIKRVLSSTDPMSNQYEEIKKTRIEDSTRRYKQNREIDSYTKELTKDPASKEARQGIVNTIKNAPDFDKERLVNRVLDEFETVGIPDKRWWKSVEHLTAEARADVWYKKYVSLPKDEQKRFLETTISIPGFLSERTIDRIINLKEGSVKPQGE